MLEINLLGEVKKPGKKKPPPGETPEGSTAINLLCLVIVLIPIGWVGLKFYQLNKELTEKTAERARKEDEKRQYEPFLNQIDELNRRREELARKIDLIDSLKGDQLKPILMMDHLYQAVPPYLWLEALSDSSGNLMMTGKARTFTSVTNFVANLRDSEFFANVHLGPVNISNNLHSFTLSCQFQIPEPETPEAEEETSS